MGRFGVVFSRWLLGCVLACLCGWAAADDDEPIFHNFAQLGSISVGGVATGYRPNPLLGDSPLRVTIPNVRVDHCAAQRVTVGSWDRGVYYEVQGLGQTVQMGPPPWGHEASIATPLAFGANTVELAVTASTHHQVFYTLNVERTGPGTNAELAAVALSRGTLSPPFDPSIYRYSAIVNDSSVAVSATAVDCPQITVNGQQVGSGGAVQVPLAPGPNVVTVQSTAQDGTTRSFELALTRVANANADLRGLALSAGTLSPAFDSGVSSYAATVPYAASVAVTPTPAASTATLTINGAPAAAGVPHAVALHAGANAIAVRVQSEDGSATRTYTVNATRAGPDTNARLSALGLSAGALSPAFDPAVLLYSASVASSVDAVTVTPIPAFAGATVAVNGTLASGGGGGGVRVPLVPGPNTISVQATAQDGSTQQTYTLRVARASLVNNARLRGLVLSSGTPWPPVHPDVTAYTARAAGDAATLTLTPTMEDVTGSVRINGAAPLASGETSAPQPLAVGNNLFTVQVTSTDGLQTATYTLDVLRGNTDATLSGLALSAAGMGPAFDPAVLEYSATVPYSMDSVRVAPTLADPQASVRVGGRALRSAHAVPVALAPGLNTVRVQVTASDGAAQRTYLLRITRAAPQAGAPSDQPARFAPPLAVPLANSLMLALQARDANADGRADLLAVDIGHPSGFAMAAGQADGSFAPAQWVETEGRLPLDLVPGDFLGQGWLDLVAVDEPAARVLRGLGNGVLDMHPTTLDGRLLRHGHALAHDVDGDGRQDLLAGDGDAAVVLRSLGDGSFAPPQAVGTLAGLRYVAAGDFNGDGHADLLLLGNQGGVKLLPGLPHGGFGTPWSGGLGGGLSLSEAPPAVADLNGDGRDDIAVAVTAGADGLVVVMFGQPDGSLGEGASFDAREGAGALIGGEVPYDIQVGDLNGDGHPDLAVLQYVGIGTSLAILRGQGEGRFAAPQQLDVESARRVVLADFDHDGKSDLALGGHRLRVLRNTTPDLARVTVSSGVLSPAFDGDATGYTVQLPHGASKLALTPWLAFGAAMVRVNGVDVPSGTPAPPVAVAAGGSATLAVEVLPPGGAARTYTFTATRAMPDTNAQLGALALSSGSLEPAFNADTLQYTATVEHAVAVVTLTPMAAEGSATVRVNGALLEGGASASIALTVGANPVTVLVTAQSGATRSYVVNVVRSAAPTQFTGSSAGGAVTAGFTGGGAGCGFASSRLVPASSVAPALPAGVSFPHPLFDFSANGCTAGATLHFRVTYPAPLPPGARYWKWGPTPANTTPHWYELPATISGNTVLFSVTDGGLGDDDFALGPNGQVVDAGGVGVPALAAATPVPTLSQWALLGLSAGVMVVGGVRRRRRA